MKFRIGLTLGFAAGYLLGARAGRERYEQITKAAKGLWNTEPVQRAADRSREVIGEGMSVASDKIREVVDRKVPSS